MHSDADDRQPVPEEHPDSSANPSTSESTASDASDDNRPRRRILIGSQRDLFRPNPKRDQIPVVDPEKTPPAAVTPAPEPPPPAPEPPVVAETPPAPPAKEPVVSASPATPPAEEPVVEPPAAAADAPAPQQATAAEVAAEQEAEEAAEMPVVNMKAIERQAPPPRPTGQKKIVPPSPRRRLSPELEEEFEEMLDGVSLEELIATGQDVTSQEPLELESKHSARVISVRRDDVFVELGGREQGILPLGQFKEPPEAGTTVEVVVSRFNRDDGLYELSLPGAAASVGDWSDLEEGIVVEARVTGHNTGGLECEVNHIRGFIPVSQISLYRVENLEEFVGQKFTCLVTEANPQRGNLVLSRRAVLEREREEARENLLESLAPGQIHEGVVRKLMDFGAFVDLGGVDGLLHVSQLAWGRVKHPSEVIHEGQHIKVRVDKVDQEARRISLSYRDLLENPWTDVAQKYPVNTPVHGKVTRLMEFGAFVELEPGVEGLVHISELAPRRVWRVSDVVKEDDEVDVMVLSVDPSAQRISLSMKSLMPEPVAAKEEEAEPEQVQPAQKTKPRQPDKPLKGGLGRSAGGDRFGLKW